MSKSHALPEVAAHHHTRWHVEERDQLSLTSVLRVRLDSISIPKTVHETLSHSGWRSVMIEEVNA